MPGFVHWRSSLKAHEAGIAVQFSRQVRQRNFTAASFCFVCFTRRARKRKHSDYVGLRSSKALSNVCCRDFELWLLMAELRLMRSRFADVRLNVCN